MTDHPYQKFIRDDTHREAAERRLNDAAVDLASGDTVETGAAMLMLTLALGHALLALDERLAALDERLTPVIAVAENKSPWR